MTASETKTSSHPLKGTRIARVESVSGAKTVRVVLERLVRQPVYGKILRRRTRLLVHDEKRQAQVGDVVEVAPCRPLSKTKSWRLVRVLRKSAGT
jgi:small subunit ribosomal protein S17